jgi:diguanylate cyclase (GGDEF)-like protein/putative nucleotidyltransferase with HDIG domain
LGKRYTTPIETQTQGIVRVLLISLALYVVLSYWIPSAVRDTVTNATPIPGAIFAAWWGQRAYWRCRATGSKLAPGWAFLSFGSLVTAIAASIYVHDIVKGIPFATVEPRTDSVFLLGLVVLCAGTLLVARVRPKWRAERRIEVALIGVTCLAIGTFVFVFPAGQHQSLPFVYEAFNVLFGIGDIVLLVLCVVLLGGLGNGSGTTRSSIYVAMGGLALIAGDAVYDAIHVQHAANPGLFADIPWFLAFFFIGIGALWVPDPDTPETNRRIIAEPGWNLISCLVPLAGSCLLLSADYHDDGLISPLTMLVCAVLAALYVARQTLALGHNNALLRENQAISDRLKAFNDHLEAVVRQRTRHLEVLHNIAMATKSTLDEAKAMRLCVEGTVTALQADGGAVMAQDSTVPLCIVGNGPLDEILIRIEHWVTHRTRNADPNLPELKILFTFLAESDPAQGYLIVWRMGAEFTDDDDALVESIGAELRAAREMARMHAITAEAAESDPVTGLLNNKSIKRRLRHEVARAQRDSRTLAVIMMDLDDFKIFNDTFGHPVGDEVLRHVASVLQQNTRSFDLVARYGGDEFAAVLPGADGATAGQFIDRVRSAIFDGGFRHNEEVIPLRMSFGVSIYPENAINGHDLLASADAQLYAAKRRRGQGNQEVDLRAGLGDKPGFKTLDTLIDAVDSRDHYTRRHSTEVAACAIAMARALGWSEAESDDLRMAALLHNVGKIGVAESILRKPGKLTDAEFKAMQRHTDIGNLLARSIEARPMVWDAARYHHERWDGKGYPRGLKGDTIPKVARLVAVADSYCAMTTHRPYRRAMSSDDALQRLLDGAGLQWDPLMVDALWRTQRMRAEEPADPMPLVNAS